MRNALRLTADVEAIIEVIARKRRGPEDCLRWEQHQKFRADLMNSSSRWDDVSLFDFIIKLRLENVADEDVTTLADWLRRVQAGHKFTPHHSLRNFRYEPLTDS